MVHLPTPFSTLPRTLPPDPDEQAPNTKFWIKHEDSNSGLGGGGNKIRKLEYVLPEALAVGATALVTTGGLQSNHMRQVAAVGARYGLKTHLLPVDMVKSKDPEYKTLGNVQATHLLSANHFPVDYEVEKAMSGLYEAKEIPYWISSGASLHPLGGCGYARFAFEVAEQEDDMDVYFDTIIVACASGSTLAGMITGFKLLEQTRKSSFGRKQRKIIGIDAFARASDESEKLILQIAHVTAEKIGLKNTELSIGDVVLDKRWNAGEYGKVDQRTKEAIKLLASLEGIITDPVYSGKAAAGLIGKARLGEFKGCENVLFIHTGGVTSLSAYPGLK